MRHMRRGTESAEGNKHDHGSSPSTREPQGDLPSRTGCKMKDTQGPGDVLGGIVHIIELKAVIGYRGRPV